MANGKPVLVVQSFRGPFDQGKKSLASGRNVRTVLNVVRRPETLGSGVVPLVEKRVESLQHESLVLFLDCLRHLILLRFTLPRLPVPQSRRKLGGSQYLGPIVRLP